MEGMGKDVRRDVGCGWRHREETNDVNKDCERKELWTEMWET